MKLKCAIATGWGRCSAAGLASRKATFVPRESDNAAADFIHMEGPMADKTMLVMPGSKIQVAKVIKRAIQVASSVALTAGVALVLMLGSGLLQGKGTTAQAWQVWLSFINRPDIQATMVLTALVTVLFVYWQRDQERGGR